MLSGSGNIDATPSLALAMTAISALVRPIGRSPRRIAAMKQYDRCPPDIVKSVQQRWLLSYWSKLRHGAALPLSDKVSPEEIESCRDDLTVLDVEAHNGAHQFRIFDHGKNVGAMYAGQCAGKLLVETLTDAARAPTLETYEQAVHSRKPVYTVSHISDADGRPVIYERLLLPLANAEGRVVRILALLETISIEGRIDRNSLMTRPMPDSGYVVKAELQMTGR